MSAGLAAKASYQSGPGALCEQAVSISAPCWEARGDLGTTRFLTRPAPDLVEDPFPQSRSEG
jgi:hypothetical protein